MIKAVFLFALISYSIVMRFSHAQEASEEEARRLVQEQLTEAGFFNPTPWIDPWTVRADEGPENECLSEFADEEREIADTVLKGRRYFTFRYVPGSDVMFGSTLCLFFDRTTRKIIEFHRE
jgi:hypothetical protein